MYAYIYIYMYMCICICICDYTTAYYIASRRLRGGRPALRPLTKEAPRGASTGRAILYNNIERQ